MLYMENAIYTKKLYIKNAIYKKRAWTCVIEMCQNPLVVSLRR